jgi:hypothetical protein
VTGSRADNQVGQGQQGALDSGAGRFSGNETACGLIRRSPVAAGHHRISASVTKDTIMIRSQFMPIVLGAFLMLGLSGSVLAQQPPANCGPDHAILYKRAVKLLDNAEKKLTAGYTAEAKSQAKEANSLFTILHKECGPQQAERALTDQELQQEAINQKLAADELAQAERLIKSAEEKTQKAVKLETTQPEVYLKYQREAKAEFEQAHKRSIKSAIYALRNQQMVFSWLSK